jgi:hypothetical protein
MDMSSITGDENTAKTQLFGSPVMNTEIAAPV